MAPAATLDRTFEALANEHRRTIVDRLTAGPLDTPTLRREFDMSKQALSKHLGVLEAAGLIERQRSGRVDKIHLHAAQLDQVSTWVSRIRRGWEASLDQLGLLLDVEPDEPETPTPRNSP